MPRALFLLAIAALLPTLLGAPCGTSSPVPGVGFRWSPYGVPEGSDPGVGYWADVAVDSALGLPGSVPRGIWLACEVLFDSGGTLCDFDGSAADPLIAFTGDASDPIAAALSVFDAEGVQVWLQVEPGFADVDELISLLLDRYGNHPSVYGVGVDLEWYRNAQEAGGLGEPVGDVLARRWVETVRSFVPRRRLFLKHWRVDHMPLTERAFITFVDDSQEHVSLAAMVAEFAAWNAAFAPGRVAFQYGYDSDRAWWAALPDPPHDVAAAIRAGVPRASGLFWVDFTALDVFPPPE